MNTNKLFVVIFSFSLFYFVYAAIADDRAVGKLRVEISGIRVQQKGNLIFGLYKGQENWLKKGKVYAGKVVAVAEDAAVVTFEGLPLGDTYALFVYHDKNDNEKLDFRTFPFPRPREGLAVSNNAVRWGKPHYKKARFSVEGNEALVQIKMHY